MSDAQQALSAGKLKTAEIQLKTLLQQKPNDAAARLMLGRVALAEQDPAAAEASLRRALELGSDPAEVQLPLLQALLAQGKYRDVLAQLQVGPTPSDPERVATLVVTATARRGLRQFDSAEAAYRAALEIDPSSPALRTDLAALYFQTGRRGEGNGLVTAVLAERPDFTPALVLHGTAQLAAGDFAGAEASFASATSLLKKGKNTTLDYADALNRLAEVHLAQHKIDEAAANADELLTLAPANPVAIYLKARVEIEQGKDNEAARRLEDLVARFPRYWAPYTALGMIKSKQNQTGQALMYLRAAANNNPGDRSARLLLAELYVRQGDIDGAKAALVGSGQTIPSDSVLFALAGRENRKAGNATAAAELFARSERGAAGSLRDLVGLSSLYMASGEFERAIRVLQSSSSGGDKDRVVADYLLAVAQLSDRDLAGARATVDRLTMETSPAAWLSNLGGTIALLSRDLPRAGDLFAEALKLDRAFTPALVGSARVALLTNRPAEAEASFKRVLELDPQTPTGVDAQQTAAMLGLALLAANRRDFAEARAWLARLPESADRLHLDGQVAAAEGRFAEAATAFSRAYATQPTAQLALLSYAAAARANRDKPEAELLAFADDHPGNPEVNLALGVIALSNRDDDAAIKRFVSVLDVDQNNIAALNNLARLYDQRGDHRGLELAQRAHDLQPEDPATADALGWIQVRAGDSASGLRLLEQAAASSDEPEIRYHWAVALAAQGNAPRSREILRALLATNQDFPSRRDAEERLKRQRD